MVIWEAAAIVKSNQTGLKVINTHPILSSGIGNINICQMIAQTVIFDCPLSCSL